MVNSLGTGGSSLIHPSLSLLHQLVESSFLPLLLLPSSSPLLLLLLLGVPICKKKIKPPDTSLLRLLMKSRHFWVEVRCGARRDGGASSLKVEKLTGTRAEEALTQRRSPVGLRRCAPFPKLFLPTDWRSDLFRFLFIYLFFQFHSIGLWPNHAEQKCSSFIGLWERSLDEISDFWLLFFVCFFFVFFVVVVLFVSLKGRWRDNFAPPPLLLSSPPFLTEITTTLCTGETIQGNYVNPHFGFKSRFFF